MKRSAHVHEQKRERAITSVVEKGQPGLMLAPSRGSPCTFIDVVMDLSIIIIFFYQDEYYYYYHEYIFTVTTDDDVGTHL